LLLLVIPAKAGIHFAVAVASLPLPLNRVMPKQGKNRCKVKMGPGFRRDDDSILSAFGFRRIDEWEAEIRFQNQQNKTPGSLRAFCR
jgi:hypothetical protein